MGHSHRAERLPWPRQKPIRPFLAFTSLHHGCSIAKDQPHPSTNKVQAHKKRVPTDAVVHIVRLGLREGFTINSGEELPLSDVSEPYLHAKF